MSLKDRHRSITVRGLVCPSDWDIEGNVCRVSIFTFDDDEYEVEPTDAGKLLMDYSGQEVMVRAHLAPGYRRRKVVLVKSFTVFGANTTETIDSDFDLFGGRQPMSPPAGRRRRQPIINGILEFDGDEAWHSLDDVPPGCAGDRQNFRDRRRPG